MLTRTIQILFFVLLLWPISRLWLRLRDGGVKMGEFLFWTAVWCIAVFVLFYPDFLTFLAKQFGIGRGSDLALYGSIVILFYLVFRTNVALENVRHELSRLVREIALHDAEKKHS